MELLKDKICLVSGASRGIGSAIAKAFAFEGAKLSITARDRDSLQKIEQQITALGSEVISVVGDVTIEPDVEHIINCTIDTFGRLDIACNNAGVSSMSPGLEITRNDWDFNMDINAKAVFFACQLEARQMTKQRAGKIINIASMASKRGIPLLAHYCASKYAVIGFSKSLALELAEKNITVNCICPGLVKTEMQDREVAWEAKLRNMTKEEVVKEYISSTPLGRLETPEDVAKVAVFLASDMSDFVTGQAINVTGGIETN